MPVVRARCCHSTRIHFSSHLISFCTEFNSYLLLESSIRDYLFSSQSCQPQQMEPPNSRTSPMANELMPQHCLRQQVVFQTKRPICILFSLQSLTSTPPATLARAASQLSGGHPRGQAGVRPMVECRTIHRSRFWIVCCGGLQRAGRLVRSAEDEGCLTRKPRLAVRSGAKAVQFSLQTREPSSHVLVPRHRSGWKWFARPDRHVRELIRLWTCRDVQL